MAFYLTQRAWAGFISGCREIWEPLLLGSIEVNLAIDPSPAPIAYAMCEDSYPLCDVAVLLEGILAPVAHRSP